ncbi:MAG: hypothetical protein ACPGUD_02840 [Parashewanella sp.]
MSTELKQQLKLINQQISQIVKEIDSTKETDLERSEQLASGLQLFLEKRQTLIEEVVSANADDETFLKQQKMLAKDFMEKLILHRQFYFDAMAKVKSSSPKVDVYQSVDSNR